MPIQLLMFFTLKNKILKNFVLLRRIMVLKNALNLSISNFNTNNINL